MMMMMMMMMMMLFVYSDEDEAIHSNHIHLLSTVISNEKAWSCLISHYPQLFRVLLDQDVMCGSSMAKCNSIVLETFGKHPCSQNSASESIEEKRESIGKDSIWKPSLLLSFNYEPAINACAHHGSPCRNRHTSWNIGLIHCGCSFAQVGATSDQSPRSSERAFLHMNPGAKEEVT